MRNNAFDPDTGYGDLWDKMVDACLWHEENPDSAPDHGIWTDGTEFLFKTKAQAEAVADFLEALGFSFVRCAYYDPEEDARDNCVDDHTGYWYVDWD